MKCFKPIALAILIGFTSIALLNCSSIRTGEVLQTEECSQRFFEFNIADRKQNNEVMRRQNFILSEAVNNRLACAKQIANQAAEPDFRDYFVGLAHYFDFGSQASYLKAYEALWRFGNQEKTCTRKIGEILKTYDHVDCGAPFVMQAFLLLETDNRVFLETPGEPFRLDQSHHLFFGLQNAYSILPALIRSNRNRKGPPQSLLIDQGYLYAYVDNLWKVFNALSYRIAKAAESSVGSDFVIFGNKVGSTENNQSFWTNSEFNDYGRVMLQIHYDYLKAGYYSERELEAGDYLGNNPASYCEARLFILDLIFEGNFALAEKRASKPYRNCLTYHESRWS